MIVEDTGVGLGWGNKEEEGLGVSGRSGKWLFMWRWRMVVMLWGEESAILAYFNPSITMKDYNQMLLLSYISAPFSSHSSSMV